MASNIEKSYQERILKVLIYIQNNLDGDLSLEALSSIACFSAYHFHRIFTANTGESIKSYIRRLRLNRATRDLSFTNKSISQIAERAGYDTQQSFHRAFKEAFDVTPKTFREKSKSQFAQSESTALSPSVSDAKNYTVNLVQIDPIPVIFLRHVGPYQNLLNVWMKMTAEVGMDIIFAPERKKIGIAYDSTDITPEDKLRYDACISAEGVDIKPKGDLGSQTIAGGHYAVITHQGSLETIEETYLYLFSVWLPNSGYEPGDSPNFMLHRNLPFQTPNDQLLTDIYLPLKNIKKGRSF